MLAFFEQTVFLGGTIPPIIAKTRLLRIAVFPSKTEDICRIFVNFRKRDRVRGMGVGKSFLEPLFQIRGQVAIYFERSFGSDPESLGWVQVKNVKNGVPHTPIRWLDSAWLAPYSINSVSQTSQGSSPFLKASTLTRRGLCF